MRRRAFALGLAMIVGGVPCIDAQAVRDTSLRSTPDEPRGGWLFGASFGVPGYEDEPWLVELFTVGIHGTYLRGRGQPGFDYSIGTMPRVLGEGVLVLGLRTGVAVPLMISRRALLLPSAGVSLVGGVGGEGGGALAGLNVGIAGVALGLNGTGLRTGITWHRFEETTATVWLVELGVVGLRGR